MKRAAKLRSALIPPNQVREQAFSRHPLLLLILGPYLFLSNTNPFQVLLLPKQQNSNATLKRHALSSTMSEQLDRDQTTPQGADNDDTLGSGDPSRKRQRVQDDDDDSDSKPGQFTNAPD